MAGWEAFWEGPERPFREEAILVKPGLWWRAQDVGDVRGIRYFAVKKCRQEEEPSQTLDVCVH